MVTMAATCKPSVVVESLGSSVSVGWTRGDDMNVFRASDAYPDEWVTLMALGNRIGAAHMVEGAPVSSVEGDVFTVVRFVRSTLGLRLNLPDEVCPDCGELVEFDGVAPIHDTDDAGCPAEESSR